jgi:hypothetical protein
MPRMKRIEGEGFYPTSASGLQDFHTGGGWKGRMIYLCE